MLKRASHTDNNGKKKLKSKYKVTQNKNTKKAKKEGKRRLKRKDYLFLLNIEVDNTKDSFSVVFFILKSMPIFNIFVCMYFHQIALWFCHLFVPMSMDYIY